MTSKKDQNRIDELSNMVDRLNRRLNACRQQAVNQARQLEILYERHGYTDEQIDELKREVLNEG